MDNNLYLVDSHVHFIHGADTPYTVELLEHIVSLAQLRNINEIYLLEHTHQFQEFRDVYKPVFEYNDYQNKWLSKRMNGSIQKYIDFIDSLNKTFTVKIKFGLEVCYIDETADILSPLLRKYKKHFDFYTGAVHWIDGFGFDFPGQKHLWETISVDIVYDKYYKNMAKLISSDLFDGLAHPDSIKCFGHTPSYNLENTYHDIAALLKKHNVYAEHNGGVFAKYPGRQMPGLNKHFLEILLKNKVDVYPASDAHKPDDVGLNIDKLQKQIDALK